MEIIVVYQQLAMEMGYLDMAGVTGPPPRAHHFLRRPAAQKMPRRSLGQGGLPKGELSSGAGRDDMPTYQKVMLFLGLAATMILVYRTFHPPVVVTRAEIEKHIQECQQNLNPDCHEKITFGPSNQQ
jgi:hypothetical protein